MKRLLNFSSALLAGGIVTLAAVRTESSQFPDHSDTSNPAFVQAESEFRGSDDSRPFVLEPNAVAENQIVINEIMFHPSSERTTEEYIELYNTGAAPVCLTGWRFSKGIDFTFPNISISGGDYLVVAAEVGAFQAKYPSVTNVVGGWDGLLSNHDEEIELENALGETVASVSYADQGDWAIRRRGPLDVGHRGWEWFSEADSSFGKSLELINPNLPNEHGQNWKSSLPTNGTPGVVNSVFSANLAPLVLEVQHLPLVPRTSDSVIITARILDENGLGISAVARWRVDGATSFAASAMYDDGLHNDGAPGDSIYAARIPPQTNNTVVEFYVEARDLEGNARTWPAAALDQNGVLVQEANALYQVDNSTYTGTQPIYRLIMRGVERTELAQINASTDSNAEMNGTLITVDGVGAEVRYLTGIRIRGAGSRGRNPPNYRVSIPSDRRWKGVSAMNLNTQYTHSQMAGSAISRKAGLHSEEATIIQVRVNNANLAFSGLPQFGSYVHLEVLDADFAANHFPLDPDGNVYRCSRPDTQLSYLGTNPLSYRNTGYSKESNTSENDWSDLINLTFVLNRTPNSNYTEAVRQVLNVEQWLRYFAVLSLIGYNETALGTGTGDDYSLYRGVEDPRFLVLPHDHDTDLGQGDSPAPPTFSIFQATGLPTINRFLKWPDFVPFYYAELKWLADTTFSAAEINPLLDQTLGGFVPAQTINNMKTWAAARRASVLSQIPMSLTITNSLSISNGFPRSTNATVLLRGRANVIETRSVQVNGATAAWSAWEGRWTNTVLLTPGINRVRVQGLGTNGFEVARDTIDIWYDDGTVSSVSGILSGQNTWSPTAGPYLVTSDLTVPSDSTLTIQAGTTIYFAQDTRLNIAGKLLAVGTETQRIRFTRAPGSFNTWSGLRFTDSAMENHLAYADLEYASSGDPIVLRNSTLLVDNVTWTGTTRTIIDLNDSSLIVRNSVFPTIENNETIHGNGMPANGYVIIEGNYFGGTTGYSDIIDFTGGKRPGPIIQVLDNIFNGGTDDALDLDGTDAHVEGNVFMNIHQDAPRDSSANAIATDFGSEITVARNLFYNCDHAVLLKNGAFLTAQNNTIVGMTMAAIQFDETNRVVGPGRGALLDGNILWNNAALFKHFYFNDPVEANTDLTVTHSLLQGTNWPGVGNLNADPLLFNTSNVTYLTIRNDFQLGRGSPALGAGPNGLDMGALVPAGASISGEPASPTDLTSATLTVGGPGIAHFKYLVNGGALTTEEISITNKVVLTNLATGNYTVHVVGKNSAGVWQSVTNPTISKTWTVNSNLVHVRLNEVLASNIMAVEHNGTHPDLIELYNPSRLPADLSGLRLTDDPLVPDKFVFPAGATLRAGGYLVFYADNPNGTPGDHLGFSLSKMGECLYLYDKATNGGAVLDSVCFGLQLTDFSIGRLSDGQWALTQPSFGSANIAALTGEQANLKINEWLAAGILLFADDFIELYNPEPWPVSLGGLYLTDNPLGWPARYQMAQLSFIAANNFTAFTADGDVQRGSDHLNFRLQHEQGMIGLFDAHLSVIDCVIYGPQRPLISQGRTPTGSSAVAFFNTPTPGAANQTPNPFTTNAVVINEVLANNATLAEADGSTPDWLELHNLSTNSVDLADMSLTDTLSTPRRYVFPTGVTIPALGYLRVRCDGDLSASSTNTGFGLKASGGVLYLFDKIATGGAVLSSVSFGLQAADWSIGRVPNGTGTWILTLPTPESANIAAALGDAAALKVNEWLAAPLSGDDWFEIYNPNPQPVALGGLHLTDDLSDRTKYQIPPLSFIGAHADGYQIFVADNQPDRGADHTNFKLDADGESIGIATTAGILIDGVTFDSQQPDVSEGRLPDGGPGIASFPTTPTPGASNFLPLPNAVINEVLARAEAPLEQAIEIYNLSNQGADLSGWYLSDTAKEFRKYRIPDGTVLPAGAYVVFYETQFNGGVPVGFRLDGERGGAVYLSAADAAENLSGFRSETSFGAAEPGVSFGRSETCSGKVDFVALSRRSFGEDESGTVEQFRMGRGLFNAYPRVGPVVINELMYHPPGVGTNDNILDEYIELHNVTTNAVVLHDTTGPTNGWRLRGGVEFEFSTNVTLAGGAYLLLVNFGPTTNGAQLASFRNLYGVGAEVKVVGPYGGKLDNGGESVELYRPGSLEEGLAGSLLVDRVEYDDEAPWLAGGDGDGASLQRVRAGEYGNESKNWLAAGPTAGRANGALPPLRPSIVTQPLSRAVRAGSEVIFSVTVCGSLPLSHQWRYNGMELSGETNGSLRLMHVQAGQAGKYLVEVRNAGGTVISEEAVLTVMEPPLIGVQPVSQITNAGSTVTFRVTADGPQPLNYQWRLNGILLSGATNADLILPNVQPGSSGDYSVVVSNPAGSVASGVGSLSVYRPLSILAQPESRTVNPGSQVTFGVAATGNGSLVYQWRFNGSIFVGATNATLTLNNVQAAQVGYYAVKVTDSFGSVTSAPVILNLLAAPTFIQQPQSQTVVQGDTVTFAVRVSGTPPFGYRWRSGGNTVVPFGQGQSIFTITNVQLSHATNYSVAVSNIVNRSGVLSSEAVLTVLADNDGDHIPNDWETANGLDPNSGSDGPLDIDGDGMTNLQEYKAGTDPRDPDSVLKLGRVVMDGNDVRIGFHGVQDKKYRLERLENIAGAAWTKVIDFKVGTVLDLDLIDPGAASRPNLMYRIILLP